MCDCPWLHILSSLLATNYVLRKSRAYNILHKTCSSHGLQKINFIKCLKGSRAPRARIPNIKSRKNRREPCSSKLEKRRRKEEILSFSKPKIERI